MTQLLQNAAYGTAMILAVAALRWALKERLIPEARLGLWAVCLFRLLTPVSPESMWSLWGLVRRIAPAETGAQPVPAAPVPGPSLTPEAGAAMVQHPLPAAPVGTAPTPAAAPAAFPWETVLLAVWIGVGLALAARYALSWRRTRRAVRCAIPLERDDPRYAFLPRWARLREGVMDGAPLTFGAARPTVVLSPGLRGEELACVLAHEGVHARRRDNLWHYAMALALAVHWWNPAVWLMSRLLRRDIELACDKAAVKKLGTDRRADYARVLVNMATQGEGPAFCQSFGRKATEERIRSIMKFKKTTVAGVILTLVLVVGVTVAFASAPKEQDGPEDAKPAASEGVEAPAPEGAEGVKADGAPDGLNGFAVQMNGNVVTRVIVSLDVLEEDLEIRVDEGAMSKAEAELILSQAQSIAVDGVIDWTFTQDNGLRHEELPEESTGTTTVSANGYWDQDGEFVPVNISQIVSKFILPQALMGEVSGTLYDSDDFPTVEVKVEVDEQGNSIVRDENGNTVMVGVQARLPQPPCDDPDCPMAADGEHYHDENGKVVQVHYQMPGLMCTRADCTANGVHEHEGVSYDACAATCTPEQYAAALDAWVALGGVTQAEADGWLEIFQTCYDHVQAGDSDAFYYNIWDGTKWASALYKSDRVAAGYPVNSKGETYGPDMPELYGGFSPDLILAEGTKGETGYVRSSDLDCNYPGGVNNPEEALAYMEWLKTQPATRYVPLYDSEGNVIGQFGISNSEAGKAAAEPASGTASCPVCTVEGCTIEGRHEHGGVTYCGGAAHQNRGESTCDGSCLYCAQDGVNGGGHHGNGYHGGHH